MKRTAALSIASLGILLFTSVAPASAQSLGDIGRVLLNNVVGGSSYYDPYYSGYNTYPSSYYNYPTTSYYGTYPSTYYTNPYYTGYSSGYYNSYPSSYYNNSSYYYDSTLGRWVDRGSRSVAGRVLDWLF